MQRTQEDPWRIEEIEDYPHPQEGRPGYSQQPDEYIEQTIRSCVAARLLTVIQQGNLLASEQKGFLLTEGSLKHNLALQSMKQSKSKKKTCVAT